jgi:hypothetical protein
MYPPGRSAWVTPALEDTYDFLARLLGANSSSPRG